MTSARGELAALRRLAALYGVMIQYRDYQKCRVDAKPESLLAVLRSMGASIERVGDASTALRQRQDETWHWHIEPVQLAWDGELDSIELRVPAEVSGSVDLDITLEDGRLRTQQAYVSNASVSSIVNLERRAFVSRSLPLNLRLPFGYHRLTLRAKGRDLRSLIISAPVRSYAPPCGKHWGLFLPLYALHSKRSWGIGDFSDLEKLVRWSAAKGADFVGTLPLLASFLGDEPYAPSPYEPVSRLFWNEIFIDIDAAVTFLAGGLKEDGAVPAATVKAARRLNARETVPYREVMALKRRALTDLTRHKEQGPAANEAAKRFQAARPALEDYAAFRAALETLGPRWREWPSPQRSGSLKPTDYKAKTADYYALAQWLAQEQMSRLVDAAHQESLRLYLDLPIGVHPDGYDPWRYQRLFVEGMSVGAPPDLLAPAGQNWGFQPLNPLAQRQNGYKYTRAYLRRHMEAAGILRVDHAIGLHRLFWIPDGGTGADGVFVRQPSEEMYAILCLESHRAGSVIVGENLGLVPPDVNRGMARHGIGEMYVQTFALTGDASKPLKTPKRDAIASFGTHDLAPFASFWNDEDLAQRQEIGVMTDEDTESIKDLRGPGKRALWQHLRNRELINQESDTGEIYRGAMRLLAESPGRWAALSLEDTWGETEAQNVPGTLESQHANWLRRAKYGLEQFDSISDITSTLGMMRGARRRRKEQPNGGKR
jgi:4-alpha-glucanotransferase